VTSWATLVKAGAHPDDASDVVGLPRMRVEKPEPAPVPEGARAPEEEDDDDSGEPEAAMRWVAQEHIDDNTCDECKANDGKTYRNRAAAYADYPGGQGFIKCIGHQFGNDCRGKVVKRGKA
jgi:hypothetical protein